MQFNLPVKVEPHGQQIRLSGSECSVVGGIRMNPVKHDARSIAPIPVHARREVVVLPRADIV